MKNNRSKLWILLLLGLSAALALTGCASGAATQASPTPAVSPSADPLNFTANPDGAFMGTAEPGAGLSGGMTLEETKKAAEDMEDAVEKLSEISEAYVVPLGDTALVGVQFAREYQGQVDDRLKKMVLARLQTVDKAVTGVAVTDNAALVTGIEALSKAMEGASSLNDVNDKAEEILKQLTVFHL
ncbi:MAG: YhcN/YlaJ family sporulation lipoprotein [Clostridia bacterium]|nr:YhcN/YlaJ family sporulation lipoprotein [Clostridia bacterium]